MRRAVALKRKSRLLPGQYSHGPANEGRSLSADERAKVEQEMRERGLLGGAAREEPSPADPGIHHNITREKTMKEMQSGAACSPVTSNSESGKAA